MFTFPFFLDIDIDIRKHLIVQNNHELEHHKQKNMNTHWCTKSLFLIKCPFWTRKIMFLDWMQVWHFFINPHHPSLHPDCLGLTHIAFDKIFYRSQIDTQNSINIKALQEFRLIIATELQIRQEDAMCDWGTSTPPPSRKILYFIIFILLTYENRTFLLMPAVTWILWIWIHAPEKIVASLPKKDYWQD